MLGYALRRDGTPTATLAERVRLGVRLFDQGVAEHLCFSGGHPGKQDECSDAQSVVQP